MIRWLAYGIGGAGKTYFAVRAVKELGGVVFDVDGMWGSTGLPYATEDDMASGTLAGKIIFIPFDRPKRARESIKALVAANRAGKPMTKLIVFDGFSEYETKKSHEIAKGESLERQHWGELLVDEQGLKQMLAPEETGAHLYATARMREMSDPLVKGKTLLRPSLAGRFGQDIESGFDIVSAMFHEADEDPATGGVVGSSHRAYFRRAGYFITVARQPWSEKLPPYIETTLDEQGKVKVQGPDLLDMLVRLGEVEIAELKRRGGRR